MTQEEQHLEFIEKNKPLIIKVASSYCYDAQDRSDLIQDILLQIWKAFPKYDEAYQSSTWVYKIALNISISSLRKAKNRAKVTKEYTLNYDVIHSQNEELEAELTALNTALEGLNPYDKAIVILKLKEPRKKKPLKYLG